MGAFIQACVEAGHPPNSDFNGASQDGVGLYQVTQRNGMRCSTAAAYLHPAISRPNLKVLTDAFATHLFEGNQASGVEIVRNGQVEEVRADTEVILAAGTYNSPQLLLLSALTCGTFGNAPDLRAPRFAGRYRVAGPSGGVHELVHGYGNADDRPPPKT